MSNLRRAAAVAVAQAIASAVASTDAAAAANCKAGEDDQESGATYPSIRVLTRAIEFTPWQEESVGDDADPALAARELSRVGDFDGRLQIRVYHNHAVRREALEQAILDLLIGTEGAPGNFVVQTAPVMLRGVQTLYPATVSCFLDEGTWEEELVFEKKRMSFLELDFSFPGLALRDAPVINEIRLALEVPMGSVEEVTSIDEDGTLTPSS
jgi:hypothetical protein